MSAEPVRPVIPISGPALIPHGFNMPASDAGLVCEPSLADPPPAILPEIVGLVSRPGVAAKTDTAAAGLPAGGRVDDPPIQRPHLPPQESGPN